MKLRHALAFAGAALLSPGTGAATPELPSETPQGLAAAEWQGIRAAHEAWKHRFTKEEDGTVSATNPGQQWRTEFDGRGFTASPAGQDWQWGLELQSYGVGEVQVAVGGKARVEITDKRLIYHWGEQLEEWFLNDSRGLEQGWTIRTRPGDGGGDSLRLDLAVRGGLRAEVSERSIAFTDTAGAALLNYGGLKAWDATGRALPVRFLAAGENIAVEVDERDAVYPVTIDPLAQQAYLKPDNTGANDEFGTSVAISGDTVVVGAPWERSGSTGVNSDGSDNSAAYAGAAYVFVRHGAAWTQQAYLKPDNTGANDEFGTSVAISGDTIVVGAPWEDRNSTTIGIGGNNNDASSAGAIYVFVRHGTAWTQQAYLKAHNAEAGDGFGFSVAISGDSVVVSAPWEDSNSTTIGIGGNNNSASDAGAAYVFVREDTTWSQQAYLKAHNAEVGDGFGFSVAISGDSVVVGAPREDSNSTTIGIGGNNNDASAAGAAYVFVRHDTAWTQQAYLKPDNTGAGDEFGTSVAISGDCAVVGAIWEDSSSTGVNSDGSDNSASAAGAAYVFVRQDTAWTQQAYLKPDNTGAGDEFGASVAISGDRIVVGAPKEDSGSTGVNSDGSDNSATFAGAAYVFVGDGTTWTQQAYLKAHNAEANDRFGTSVAVSGDSVVGGAPLEDNSSTGVNNGDNNFANNAGAAYLFEVVVPPAPATSPTLKITGRKTVRTTKPRHRVTGTAADADGNLARVEAKDTRPKGVKKFRKAKGSAKWKYQAPLKTGRNKIQVRAVDATGRTSKTARITVVRQR